MTKKTKNNSSQVLYIDHSGHPAPLSLTYHATASRVLSCSLPLIPPSTITEIDTAYCPQCLYYASYASATASTSTNTSNKGNCPNAQCRACPVCASPLTINILKDQNTAVYACNYCRWDSKECDVQVSLPAKPMDNDLNALEKLMAQDLANELQTKMDAMEMECGVNDAFQNLLSQWGKRAQDEERRRRYGDGSGLGLTSSSTRKSKQSLNDGSTDKSWSVETLEKSCQDKQLKIQSDMFSNIWQISPSKGTTLTPTKTSKDTFHDADFQTQGIQNAGPIVTSKHVFPLRIPLKPKTSRRCRAEIQRGKPGILVKPKTNPLEGDSSLRSGHGQWWKKDSSAIHMIPKVQIVQCVQKKSSSHALLLKVTNPTLGPIKLRFHLTAPPSSTDSIHDPIVKQLLIDHVSKNYVDALLVQTPTSSSPSLTTTEIMELEPVEDAFLELGKGRIQNPVVVDKWNGLEVLESWERKENNKNKISQAELEIIASDKDVAWIQVLLEDHTATFEVMNEKSLLYRALHMMLDIEVGNGSWESSLIKRHKDIPVDDIDWVPLQLLLVWNANKSE